MSNRTIEAILRLSAKLGDVKAFNRISNELARVDARAKQFNRSQMLVAKGSRVMNAALLRYAAPAAIAYGLKGATVAFADIERTMTRIGITADASRERMAGVRTELFGMADELKAPVENLVAGLDSLVASGKSLDEAMALLPAVAKTAHAAGADFGEMATTADAIGNSFGIAAASMERAFDIIAKGGKAGKFELKDMANYLPSLSPAFAALGYSGEEGLKKLTAALQVVRMETGRSEEAATAFMDVLTKMNSTTIANNFEKNFGVDLPGSMKKAKESGEDLLDAFVRISRATVKGDLSKLPLLFTDKQMLIGMRALINHTGDLNSLFRELSNAAGTVNADIAKLAEDSQSSIDRMANAWDRMKQAIGKKIAPAATGAMDAVANKLAFDDAIEAALKKRGMSDAEIRKWWSMNLFDPSERGRTAFEGGWRSDAGKIIAKGPMAKSPEMPADAITGPAGAGVPLPRSRPDPNMPYAPPSQYVPRKPKRVFAPAFGVTHRGAERESMDALKRDQGVVEFDIERALMELEAGGRKAGEQLGTSASDGLTSKATSIGTAIGDAAAAKIRQAIAGATIRADTGKSAAAPGQL